MGELKKKTVAITDQIKSIEADISKHSRGSDSERAIVDELKRAVAKMEQFLSLQDITNVEMRQIVSKIEVGEDGATRIYMAEEDMFEP